MLKILALKLEHLNVKLYFAFMQFVMKAISNFAIISEKFSYYVGKVEAAYAHLNHVYLKYDRVFYTEEVQNADTERDLAFRKLRDVIAASKLTTEKDEIEAARILMKIIDLYGGPEISRMKMDEESAALSNLIEDFEEKYADEVETLGVSTLLANLKQAQQHFLDVSYERVEFDSDLGRDAMVKARKQLNEAYRDLVTAINLEAKRDAEGELTDFIKVLNEKIRKNFIYTGQTASSADTGEDGEVTIPVKTATFKFADGRTEGFPVEVGSVLIAPTNTEGYKWKPDVPEFMPTTNKTFREVPIEDKEAVATFHFFDHTEEEVRQLVGTLLHAPENTPGYYWDPEVPETMPAENTSYYELPEEEETEPTLYKVRYMKGGELFAEQEYEAGAVIQAPEPPAGYDWEEYPYRMPAEDITVNAVRRNIPGGGGGSGFE